jgi:hypothetical protein
MRRQRHYHCPSGCENPQPFRKHPRGWLLCGLCYFFRGQTSRMMLCNPKLCD